MVNILQHISIKQQKQQGDQCYIMIFVLASLGIDVFLIQGPTKKSVKCSIDYTV